MSCWSSCLALPCPVYGSSLGVCVAHGDLGPMSGQSPCGIVHLMKQCWEWGKPRATDGRHVMSEEQYNTPLSLACATLDRQSQRPASIQVEQR